MRNSRKIVEDVLNKEGTHLYFIGIGGKGLNGIAKYCLAKGFKVSGSDKNDSIEVEELKNLGAVIFSKHEKENITEDIDLVIHSSVIEKDNEEILKGEELKIPFIKRSIFLGGIIQDYKSIAICGSHGKSTTTALMGLALLSANQDPTIFGGALIKELNSYGREGEGDYCVLEACEYDRSFHDLVSDVSIITSMEKSHMEYYLDEKDMQNAFAKFVSMHNGDSSIIYNGDDMNIRSIIGNAKCQTFSFGFNIANDYIIKNVYYKKDSTCFDISYGKESIIKDVCIKIPGFYNVYNFAAVVITLHRMGIHVESIRQVARTFCGVGRRFEISKVDDKTVFVDDFCHHPTQVKNLFKGIKQFFPEKKVVAVFQPRQYHLIRTFLREYGEAFKDADIVLVTPILAALGDTDKDKNSLTTSDIIESIKRYSGVQNVFFAKDFNRVLKLIAHNKDNKIVTTIGAGDVYKIKEMYVKAN